MWFFNRKKKRETKKISNSFKKRDSKINKLEEDLNELKKEFKDEFVTRKEFELLMDLIKSKVHEVTSRSSRTKRRIKADKILDKAELMAEIGSMLKLGLSTEEIHQEIVNVKGLCKKTCFYKYLKLVREKGSRTPRTTITN